MADEKTELKKGLALQRIFIKDVSFEAPGAPAIFRDEWKPEIGLDLQTNSKEIEANVHEVVLSLTVTAKSGDKTIFLVEVKQAGIFTIQGFDGEELKYTLGCFCPGTLYPYAREVVTDLVGKASFPQLLLAPVNFEALYQHHKQQEGGEGKAPPKGDNASNDSDRLQ